MSETVVRIRKDQVCELDQFAQADGQSRSNAAQWLIDQALRMRELQSAG